MLTIRPAGQRGVANFGWLQSRHTFSFGNYRNPAEQGFSDLLVINDDRVTPQKGFGSHPHRDMEIFSYVLDGELEHKDSMGTGSIIRPGDAQLMSAGSGVVHSEFNPSSKNGVHFLQIWLTPNQLGASPRYQQMQVPEDEKRGKLRLMLAPEGPPVADALPTLAVRQNARVYAGLFDATETATLELNPKRYAYVHVAKGRLKINGMQLEAGDGVRVRNEPALHFSQGEKAEVIVFDLRANERPGM